MPEPDRRMSQAGCLVRPPGGAFPGFSRGCGRPGPEDVRFFAGEEAFAGRFFEQRKR